MPWSWVNTEYSIHQVQHTPSTASTQKCLSSLHSHNYKLNPECSFSFRRGSIHDWPPPACSPWEHKGIVTLSHSHGCKLTNWWIESQHTARLLPTSSKYFSELARLWPRSGSPHQDSQRSGATGVFRGPIWLTHRGHAFRRSSPSRSGTWIPKARNRWLQF